MPVPATKNSKAASEARMQLILLPKYAKALQEHIENDKSFWTFDELYQTPAYREYLREQEYEYEIATNQTD